MKDNLMLSIPPDSQRPESLPESSLDAGIGESAALFLYSNNEMSLWRSILLSIGFHVGLMALIGLTVLILQFLGINLLSFDRPERVKDIEFQLVNAPDEKPRNPNTRNRAEHNTRSGGQKIPHMREAQAQRQAGNPKPQPRPQPSVAQKPTPRQPVVQQRPQPRHSQRQSQPVAQQPTQQPAPPRPRVTAPKPSSSRKRIAALPNPLAPILAPDAPGPVADTGPVVRGPAGGGTSGGSGTGGGSSAGPATVPGQFSGGGRPSGGGGPSGQGGRGSYSQYGSPGGGGGRAGIDAIAEPDFGPYLSELQRRIRRNWIPPEDREDKTVVLLFTISKDGRLLNINVKRSSGYANADGAAKMAVERSAPFRPLPAEYRNGSINVEFTFDYNVFAGKGGGITRR